MTSPAPIVCIGEMLWDVLPTRRQPGGSPFKVAVCLHQLGQPVQFISRVGDDELGRQLLAFSGRQGLATHLVQQSETQLTGVVKATMRPGQEATYRVLEPVAWDYIRYTPEVQAAVNQSAALVYGSLAARSAASRETLYRLLSQAPFKVFDVNLRPPHYSREVVKYLLRQANLVKLNRAELTEIMHWLGQPTAEATALPWLAGHFGLQTICLTDGEAGATLWTNGQFFNCADEASPALANTGSSDAFLAALLAGVLQGHPPARYLPEACAAGAQMAQRSLFNLEYSRIGNQTAKLTDSLPAP